jgi:3-hydroxyisobutyrate dehydrogenase-like beta-hydroxyacid dehydrogenase
VICGVVGCGSLGCGYVQALCAAGIAVAAFDVDATALDRAIAAGALPADTARELAGRVDVVLISVPDTPQILDAVEGVDGLAAGLSAGKVVVITSTVDPSTPIALAQRLKGVHVIDAPVSGGPVRAAAGRLAMMVGGSEEAIEVARRALEALADRIVHVGPLGHGEIAKLANNVMGIAITLGIADGLALAAKAGADVARVREAALAGSGASWILEEWMPRTVLSGDVSPHFALDLMRKDLRLIEAFAAEHQVPVATVPLARTVFDAAAAEGHGASDFSIVVSLQARRAGAELLTLGGDR